MKIEWPSILLLKLHLATSLSQEATRRLVLLNLKPQEQWPLRRAAWADAAYCLDAPTQLPAGSMVKLGGTGLPTMARLDRAA